MRYIACKDENNVIMDSVAGGCSDKPAETALGHECPAMRALAAIPKAPLFTGSARLMAEGRPGEDVLGRLRAGFSSLSLSSASSSSVSPASVLNSSSCHKVHGVRTEANAQLSADTTCQTIQYSMHEDLQAC